MVSSSEKDAVTPAQLARSKRTADLGERAMIASVAELVRPCPEAVTLATTLEELRTILMTRKLDAVPVVDEQRKVIGVVTRASLLRYSREGTEAHDASESEGSAGTPLSAAADVLTPSLHCVCVDAPVSLAISVFALYDLEEMPVVDQHGACCGLLCSRDLMRWLAQQLGYAVPHPGA